MRRRQLAAIAALIVGTVTILFAVANAVSVFPRGLVVLALVVIAGACAWYGVLRRGLARTAGLVVAGLALQGSFKGEPEPPQDFGWVVLDLEPAAGGVPHGQRLGGERPDAPGR